MRDVREKLDDIIEAIESIEQYKSRGRAAFDQEQLIQIWFVHFLQIIGEAVRTLPPEVRDQAPNIPWSNIVGMRNILVHQYFKVDLNLIWDTIEQDLPILKREINLLVSQMDRDHLK